MASNRTRIAARKLLGVDQSGRKFELTIAVGVPYEISEGHWACPTSIGGLHGRLQDMHGVDSWQALQLAYQLIASSLAYFTDDGGRLFDVDGRESVALEDLFPRLAARDPG